MAEVHLAPETNVSILPVVSPVSRAFAYLRKPRKYETPEDLQDALRDYLGSLTDPDGEWTGAPTLTGAGLFLGFHSKSWHEPYSKNPDFADTISLFKLVVEHWREQQVLMPSKGVHVQGVMFLMNRLDAAEAAKDVTAGPGSDDGPRDATALIESLWSKDTPDTIEDQRATDAKEELEKLSRMTPHEKLIWHKAKQIEAEAVIDNKPDVTLP